MAIYRADGIPLLSGDPVRDVETLKNEILKRDEQLRWCLEHLDAENLTEAFIRDIVNRDYEALTEGIENIELPDETTDIGDVKGILGIGNGGTGASTAETALQNLGIVARIGETIDLNRTLEYSGHLSSDATVVTFSVPLPKLLPSNMSTITIDSLKMNIRKPSGGYIGSSDSFVSGGEEYVGNSNYTVSFTSYARHMIEVTLKNNVTNFNSVNNVPVSLQGTIKLTIK